jgi:hypothetical protein
MSPSELGYGMLGLKNLSLVSNPTESDTYCIIVTRPQLPELRRIMQLPLSIEFRLWCQEFVFYKNCNFIFVKLQTLPQGYSPLSLYF